MSYGYGHAAATASGKDRKGMAMPLRSYPRIVELFVIITMAHQFGHGRRWELYKSSSMFLNGLVLLLFPWTAQYAHSMSEWVWGGYSRYVFIPSLLTGLISGYGLKANIKNWRYSQSCRFVGSLLGCWVWLQYAVDLSRGSNYGTLGWSCAIIAIYMDVGVMMLAAANLPEPGAPGRI